MSDPRIRPIESSHIADLIRIAEETNLNRWSANGYLDELKNPHSIMLRLESPDNLTIGFIVGRLVAANDDHEAVDAEIYNIGVEIAEQRRGLGQALLDAFVAECSSREVRAIWLEVRESNEAALSVYERNGFERVTVRRDFYADPRENGILMRCWLKR